MEKSKPFEMIAKKYQISAESAKYFLGRVQKSFKAKKPPETLILQFMESQNFETLPKPHQVATLMNKNGLWVHPLNAEPPALEDEADVYF